jgi:hypothetical protein
MRLRSRGFSVRPRVRRPVRRRIALRTFYWRAKKLFGTVLSRNECEQKADDLGLVAVMWVRSHGMWVEAGSLVAVNVARNRRCSQAQPFMISSRYI